MLPFLWGQFWKLWQLMLWIQSGHHIVNFSTWCLSVYKTAHGIWLRILSITLEKELKVLDYVQWLHYYYLVSFDGFLCFHISRDQQKQAEGNYLECRKGDDAGRVHLSQMKIITPLDEHLSSRPNVRNWYRTILISHMAAHFIELLIIAHPQVFISTFILTRVKITVAFYSILRINYF